MTLAFGTCALAVGCAGRPVDLRPKLCALALSCGLTRIGDRRLRTVFTVAGRPERGIGDEQDPHNSGSRAQQGSRPVFKPGTAPVRALLLAVSAAGVIPASAGG
jgi:hypothetical protein